MYRALFDSDWPTHIKLYFTFNNQFHNYTTRQAPSLHLPLNKRSREQFSLRFNGPEIWNLHPDLLEASSSMFNYKNK